MAERSWSGTLTYSGEVVRPSALAEVPALLAAHERVRILGTRHSFSAIGDTDGVLIDLSRLPPDLSFDEASGEVSLGCGARYADVVPFLQRRGRALPNTGSLPHINVAGAVSSGTHGSGDRLRNLSSAVREVQLLTAEGEQVTLRRGEHPDFAGAVVALGALGVVTRLTLATEPTYDVRQDVYVGLDRAAFLADPDALLGAGYSVSVFTDWDGRPLPETVVKRRIGSADDAPTPLLGVDPVGEWVGGSRISSEPESLTARGVSGPWHERLPHFRIERPPSHGAELQSEWFVPRERTGEALEAVSRVGDRLREALIVSEIRTMAADDLWLSPGYRRDSLCLHFTWRPDHDLVRPAVRAVEEALAPLAVRPHWGKVFDVGRFDVAAAYPRVAEFRSLASRFDPQGRLRNDFLERTVWAQRG